MLVANSLLKRRNDRKDLLLLLKSINLIDGEDELAPTLLDPFQDHFIVSREDVAINQHDGQINIGNDALRSTIHITVDGSFLIGVDAWSIHKQNLSLARRLDSQNMVTSRLWLS